MTVVKYSTKTVPYTIKVNNLVFGSENVGYGPTYSQNLVSNSSFDTDTIWIKETSWYISGGTANFSGSSAGAIYQIPPLISGLTYIVTYTILNYITGEFKCRCGSTFGTARNANGTYIERIIASGSNAIAAVYAATNGQKAVASIHDLTFYQVVTDFWNGIDPPTGGYTIYYLTESRPEPSIIVANNDTELIYWAKSISGNSGITSIGDALIYFRTGTTSTGLINSYGSNIVTSGLTLSLDAGNVSSYPKSGSTWYDLSGNINGTFAGNSTFNNNSIYFDGVNSRINIGTGNSFFPLYKFSIDIWFKSLGTVPTTGTNPGLFGFTYGIRGFVNNTNLSFSVDNGITFPGITTTGTKNYQDGNWYHAVFSHDGSTMSIYVNGIFNNSGYTSWSGTSRWPTDVWNLGRDNNNFNYWFYGYIPQCKIYNRILSATEINQNYFASLYKLFYPNTITDNLLLLLDATNSISYSSGTTWHDLSIYNNDGLLVSGTTYTNGSFSFNGINNYVLVGASGMTSVPITINNISVFAWINVPSSFPAGSRVGCVFSNYPASQNFTIEGHTSGRFRNWWNNGEKDFYATGFDMRDNNWHYVGFTKNADVLSIYIDGIFNISVSGASNISTTYPFKIGDDFRNGSLPGVPFTGKISNVTVYDRGLSAKEVLQNFYSTGKNIFPKTATQLLVQNPSITNGVYWLSPNESPTPFQAYCDFTTANGPWVHVGTAVGNKRGLYTYKTTWASRTTDSGDITNPYDTTASSFNAESFMYAHGNKIMIKYGQSGYTQASGFTNESWRDVYSFINNLTAWPAQPSYNRALGITERSGLVSGSTVLGSGLLYGNSYAGGNYNSYFVYAFDAGGDTMAYLTTGTYAAGAGGMSNEADHGIGANENGPNVSMFPGDDSALNVSTAFDAGTNDVTDSGGATTYNNIPFSLWIKN